MSFPTSRTDETALLLEFHEHHDDGVVASLQAALKNAIQVQFQLEDGELAVEPLPTRDKRRLILIYESAEGGAGVLRRLVEDPQALPAVAREALRICHFDPETGANRRRGKGAREDCEAACYDCLMSYRNQPDHALLDRQLIQPVLSLLSRSRVASAPVPSSRSEHLEKLMRLAGSDLERAWLRFLEAREHRLPTGAQELIAHAGTRPDFVYTGHYAAIYIDGPIHQFADRHNRDLELTERLEDLSFTVIRFTHQDDWAAHHRPLSQRLRRGEARMSFAVGSLVKARDREWVVLPESTDDLLVLRPLGGTEDETTGIYLPLERVEPARFNLPDPTRVGDFASCRLLRDAVRLGFRSSAGPFRSFAQLAVEPRPYQLVPLLMALKLDPVRLLIADDVGIGKTVEACLIARELLDRGEARNLAVLCPPHLAEQWQGELRTKFNIAAELLLASTVTRLERDLRLGESLFDHYPHLIVSTDLIKSDRRRSDFLRGCPELVIVDEAHTCASQGAGSSSRHLRNQLLQGLARDGDRHLILVTATPHSGKEEAFRSLLALLKPEFAALPDDLSGKDGEHQRRVLAQHFIQRRRGDIRRYLDADTPFPDRAESESTYKLSPEYKHLFDRVLTLAHESVQDEQGGLRVRQRAALVVGPGPASFNGL